MNSFGYLTNSSYIFYFYLCNSEVYTEVMGGCEKPSVLVTSPGSPDLHSRRRSGRHNYTANVAGRIQVITYDELRLYGI